MTFKVGDRVVINDRVWTNDYATVVDSYSPLLSGELAVRIDSQLSNYRSDIDFHRVLSSNCEPVWVDQEQEPSYYDFPQGIEVRHISAHLTSFGGQALQYVARATRLDGRNKGNPIEDLMKALDFIQWEIDRLRELE